MNWEYWPWQILYIPIMLYWLWLSAKARSLFFFFAVNPGIESGGLLIESKIEILKRIPGEYIPGTLFFEYPASLQLVTDTMETANLHFPVIVKPDHGERGWMVEKIEDSQEMKAYIDRIKINFLVQDFVDYPIELGIFYYRFPEQTSGVISSIVKKELLHVTGDGTSSIQELIIRNPRAFLQIDTLKDQHPDLMNFIPRKNERTELVAIGNHSRGTTFLNGNDLINNELVRTFDRISGRIDGFFYGRFDIRCPSLEDLYAGRNIMILELNGAKSEPAHIYQPGFSLFTAYRVLFRHWNILFDIARENHRKGFQYPPFREGWSVWEKYKNYKRMRA